MPHSGALETFRQRLNFTSNQPITYNLLSAEDALPWLALVPVLFLEIGSAPALVVVRGVDGPAGGPGRGARARRCSRPCRRGGHRNRACSALSRRDEAP